MPDILTAQEIMQKALQAENGISLSFDHYFQATRERRRLYAEREKLRRKGTADFDSLSFLVRRTEVWIIKRDTPDVSIIARNLRALKKEEKPKRILSRGKSRLGIDIS